MFRMFDVNMNIVEFPDGVKPLDIFISSINKDRLIGIIEGRSGSINHGFRYGQREITLKFLLKAHDTEDYRLLRDQLYEILSRGSFFVSESFQPGKKYSVSVDESFIPERIPNNKRFAEAIVQCVNLGLPFAESIGTTGDIDQNGINYDDEMWSYGMGLLYEDEAQKYTHNTSSFKIYNAGNIPEHHPFEQRLKITIIGANKGYELKNVTTGDKFQLTKEVNGTIVLDGPNVTDNGLAALRKTNKQFITLKPGWNVFEQNQNATVSFDFPFYYL